MTDTIVLQGTIRDFSSTTHPDFEANFDPGLPVEKGIVGPQLDSNHKPVYVGGTAAIKSTHGKAAFDKWYAADHPANAQKSYSIQLTRLPKLDSSKPDVYSYDNQAFFPIDNELLGNEGRPHNYHFTYELSTEFTYQGSEEFKFTGDDDLWVFIDDKLVIDLGGIHRQATDTLQLKALETDPRFNDPNGQKFTIGTNHSLRLFFAERHTTESHFRIDTSILLTQPIATIEASDPNANEAGLDPGEFTIKLDKAALTDLTIGYTVAGTASYTVAGTEREGTATTAGADYESIGGSILISKGQTIAKIPVKPIADQLAEGLETVIVTLVDGSGYKMGSLKNATVTIVDNPPPPPVVTIAATDPQASEIGLDPGQFTIKLDKPAIADLTIGYSVAGTATEGADYQPIGRSISIAKGKTDAVIPVKPLADQLPEAPETVVVTLLAGANYQLGASLTATVTIADNPPPFASIAAIDPQASEIGLDPGQFNITLNKPAIADLTIGYSVAGTATEGADYQPIGRSVVIPKDQTSAVILVKPLADSNKEDPETVVATLQAGSGYQLGPTATATVTIQDNPPPIIPVVTLTASDNKATKPKPSEAVSDRGEFTISLTPPAPVNMVINFSVSGTAVEGADCQPMPRSVPIVSGQSQAKITVVPMPITPQRVGAGVTQVTAKLEPSSGCKFGTQIADTVVINVPPLGPADMGGSRR